MQDGLSILCLMAGGASLLAWLHVRTSWARDEASGSRRQITGCELARQVLDHHQLNRTAVASASESRRGRSRNPLAPLLLDGKVYSGTRVSDLAEALHAALHHVELSRSVLPMALLNPRGWLFRGSVLTSWLMILAGSVIGWDSVIRIGELLFLANFLVATASLAKEWEVTGRAVSSLASLEGFGTDERVRIKRLVEAIRWRPVAELLAAPFSILWQSKAKWSKEWPVKT